MEKMDKRNSVSKIPSFVANTDYSTICRCRITDDVWLNPDDFSSIEFQEETRDYWGSIYKMGSIVTMKSGRKIFIPDVNPAQVMDKFR